MTELSQQDILKTAQLVPGNISIYKVNDTNLEPLYISDNVASLSGMTVEEYKAYIKKDASAIIISEDKEIVAHSLASLFKGKADADCAYRIFNKDRGYIWIHANGRCIGKIEGSPVILVTFFNTTNETNAQENLLNHINNSVYVIDAQSFEMLYANEFALRQLGQTNFTGKKCYKFINNQTDKCSWCAVPNMKEDSLHIEEIYLPSHDKWYSIDAQKLSWYGRPAIATFSTDITSKKKTQLFLEASNENLKATINNIPVGICVYQKIGNDITCIAANPYLARTKGIVNSIPGKKIDESFFSKIYPGENERFKENFYAIFEKGYNVFDYRTINGHSTAKDGSIAPAYIWLHLEGYAADQSDGSQIAYMCFTNITQEKESEEEAKRLRKLEEEQYSHTIDGIISALPKTIGIAHLDLTQNIYSNCHTSVERRIYPLEFGSVDYLINYISDLLIVDTEKKEFLSNFRRDNLLALFTKGQNYISYDYQYLHSDKSVRWATIAINMARNPKNGDLEAVLYSVDSDDRITLDLITKHITAKDYDNIAIIDAQYGSVKFIAINESSTTPHSEERYDDDIRSSFPKVIPPEECEQCIKDLSLDNIIKELETKDYFISSFTVITPDNTKYRKQVRYSYIDKTHQKILLTRTDITQSTLRETEQKIKLEKALETAEKANEMKSVFLSTVSHDMRTPLNGIIGYTTLALQQHDEKQTHTYLEKINTASNALLLLINDTLDLARIENGNEVLKPEIVHTSEFIDAIITTVKPSMDAKHINFVTIVHKAGDLYVKCDKMRMEKVILNLLSNAAKFTPEDGTITLDIECIDKDKHTLHSRIMVKDTGCGMSQEFIPKAFEPFTQERTADTANIGGSGLGLSIVKRLVTMMGGHIEVDSTLGKGTTFKILIDFEIVPSEQAHPVKQKKEDAETSLVGKHVLLCEDNAVNREIATALLEGEGIDVTIAVNGKEGVETFSKSAPGTYDAILMDIRMPIMNGYDAAEEIRSLHRSDATLIPIIAMTADAYDDDVKHSFKSGMNAHIPKPIDAQKMFDTLRKFC